MDLLALHNSPEAVAAKTLALHQAVLQGSGQIREGNFTRISNDDLARLFHLYDHHFFNGWLGKAVTEKAQGPLLFRLSRTMTRAGGKTIKTRRLTANGTWATHYEIAVASRMLFMTFNDVQRPVEVCGLICHDRLQALQRIMEHEIIHLVELLAWNTSSLSSRGSDWWAGSTASTTGPPSWSRARTAPGTRMGKPTASITCRCRG
ncbi:MAG: hypothetical protein NTW19_01345 [Planctomycetota bacterium]|nr:hypothetical protein [Planctomycetota bacterium]